MGETARVRKIKSAYSSILLENERNWDQIEGPF
jgi:hypothetical protein